MIRKLFLSDEPMFRDHLLRLDADSRYDRFLGRVKDEVIVEYARRCFDSDTLVLGFLEAGVVRAAGELHTAEPLGDETAEVGFSVEPEFRNKGIGTKLLKRLIETAGNKGFRHLRMNCHSRNLAMQAIARKFEAELCVEQGATVGDIVPQSSTPFSLLMETLSGAREIGRAAFNLSQRR